MLSIVPNLSLKTLDLRDEVHRSTRSVRGAEGERLPLCKLFRDLGLQPRGIILTYAVHIGEPTVHAYYEPSMPRWKSQCMAHGRSMTSRLQRAVHVYRGPMGLLDSQGLPLGFHMLK